MADMLNKFPNVFYQQIVKCFDLIFQNSISSHIRSDVAILNITRNKDNSDYKSFSNK